MEIISRADAKEKGLTRYFSGEPCKVGHVSLRSVRDAKCVECTLSRQNEKRAKLRAEKFPEGRDPWKRCDPGHKVCRKCREAKPEAAFSPDERASDGLQSQCLSCQCQATRERHAADPEGSRAKRKAYYDANPEAFAVRARAFRESHREHLSASKKAYYDRVKMDPTWKQRMQAARDTKKADKSLYDRAYRERNPELNNQRARAWVKRNPEKRSAIMKAYSARRRSNCAEGDPTAMIAAWEKAAAKVCHWCSKKCTSNYHVDHYQPLAKGGKHVIANLVISCPGCNYRKNAKDPYQFAASMGRLF